MLDDFSRTVQKRQIAVSSIVYGIACVAVWALAGGWLAVLCPVAAALCLWYYRHMAYKQFGGVTGDLAGWFLQVTELVLTAVIVIGGRLL
jgi:adenosylcobinamide-GDP ribazoletransferase